jgi:hypothetical protein
VINNVVAVAELVAADFNAENVPDVLFVVHEGASRVLFSPRKSFVLFPFLRNFTEGDSFRTSLTDGVHQPYIPVNQILAHNIIVFDAAKIIN